MNLKTLVITLILAPMTYAGIAFADNETKPGMATSNTETRTATVEKINKKTREVTLKGSEGNTFIVVCGDEVKNFDQIKKGDVVTFEYSQAVAVVVKKTTEPLTHEESTAIQTAEKGQKPGVRATRITKVSAEVENVNYDTHEMTLRGPKGRTLTMRVSDDVIKLNEIKKGDKVVAHYSEAVAINVATPAKK